MLCSICYKARRCEETFREVAQSLRYDYILEEYTCLSDAWRVYQGVALYREYRGIGGVTTGQLDVTPTPCHMCLLKIVNMAQSIYQVTTSIHSGPVASKSCDESDTETEMFSRNIKKSKNKIVSEDSDDSQATKNSDNFEASQDINSKSSLPRPRRPTGRSFIDRNPDFKVEAEKETSGTETVRPGLLPGLGVRERPRRSGGRSLFERHPDFALESQFARILRQKGRRLREDKLKKRREKVESDVAQISSLKDSSEHGDNEDKEPLKGSSEREYDEDKVPLKSISDHEDEEDKEPLKDSSDLEDEEDKKASSQDWRNSAFRASQLSRLDSALSTAGWLPAIRNGRNLETQVFNTSSSQSEYSSGINKLIDHFSRGNQSTSGKFALLKPGLSKRTVKPTRKILDGLDFRRKPRKSTIVKIECNICGVKIPKSKLRSHLELEHSNKPENGLIEGQARPGSPDNKDNISICDSEFSMSSHCTNDSYERSQNSKSRSRGSKKVSVPKEPSVLPEPNTSDIKGEIKSESDVIYEASVSQKIVDEFLCSDSDNEEANMPRRGLNAYYINNFNIGDSKGPGIPTERPQRRKRSLEERHPDFVLNLPSKKSVKCPERVMADPNILSSSENNEI